MATRFGEMLMNRRRQMGLSIQQVANTIKIRPQIIEFFEMGDFSSMPPRGYAQGMISSYARYLGLNPRMVVDAYFDELRVYEQTTSSSGGRFQDAAGYVSPRSASATGRFMMVEPPRSRYGQRPPQAGYVSEARSGHEPQRLAPGYGAPQGPADRTTSLGRPITSGRACHGYPNRSGEPTRAMQRTVPGGRRPRYNRSAERQITRGGQRPSGASRRPPEGRGGAARRPPERSRRGAPAPSTVSPVLLAGFGIALLVIIALLAMLLFRGCTPAASTDDTGSSTVTVNPTTQTDSNDTSSGDDEPSSDANDNGSTSDQDADAGASSDSGSDSDTDANQTEPEDTVVTISVAEGESSWIEVRLDGTIVYGNEVYGPWEQEYTVTESLRITANTPGSVTVKKNGETVRWDTSTSGVARINITAPQKSTDQSGDSTDDGSDAQTDGGDA